jgi:hypothetical protein
MRINSYKSVVFTISLYKSELWKLCISVNFNKGFLCCLHNVHFIFVCPESTSHICGGINSTAWTVILQILYSSDLCGVHLILYIPRQKTSMVKSGNHGGPALPLHIPEKVLSRNVQTIKLQYGCIPSC